MATRTATARTAVPNEPRPEDEEVDEVTRPSDLGFTRPEVEVQPVVMPTEVGSDGMVQVRMGRTIDEFTYGNPHVSHKLEEGKVYRMPVDIARYLYGLGALSHF
jgi:hypothetical protein